MRIFNFKKCEQKFYAFTLAEILLVMGILGVVAALTIPNLQNNMEDQKIVAKVQTMFADIDQAYKVALKKYDDDWVDGSYGPRILEFLSTKKVCDNNNSASCFASTIKKYNSFEKTFPTASLIGAIFSDGSSVLFLPSAIYIDIDGKDKGYNTLGVDIFNASFGENGLDLNNNENQSSVTNWTSWVLRYGNVDYLHCSGLSATGNTTCN